MRDIGADVRIRRKRAELTQQNVADLMGWTVRKVSMIENNHQAVTAAEYLDLIQILSGIKKVAAVTFVHHHDRGKPARVLQRA